MNIMGLITARGGSKGIPGKNIYIVAGKPLIAWTIEEAHKSRLMNKTIVSTDDSRILEVCREYGAEVPFMRPAELAGDKSSHLQVVEHAVRWVEEHQGYKVDYVMLLQPTTPLRIAEDIDKAIKIAMEKKAEAVLSVSPFNFHPYYARTVSKEGIIKDFIKDREDFLFRQELPAAYVEDGSIYLIRRDVLFEQHSLMPSRIHAYMMPEERVLDIDTPWNMHLAGLILKDRNGK
ncbi:MAG: hypothetical protein A2017_12430 [Lentisphaerae bacterium GWF2_44_16]|nr:MAG: hypothetical protein A2017_12430 [Lentisphaerae bacterium GWF2_44_16]